MISLFQIASADQSVNYLGQIFGVVSAGVLSPASAPQLLGTIFKVFNTSVLTLGVCIVIYTTIVGLLKTAQEGEFLGKQWSSLWVPLRTVFGIAALFPLPTGYCAIQVIFMWIIMQGVGAADTLWNEVLTYTVMSGNPTAPQSYPNNIGLYSNMQGLFQGLVCQAEYARTNADYTLSGKESGTIQYYCKPGQSDTWCQTTITNAAGNTIAQVPAVLPTTANETCTTVSPLANSTCTFQIGPTGGSSTGACGTLTYCNESAVCNYSNSNPQTPANVQACQVCKAQKTALNQIIPVLASIAESFAEADDDSIKEVYCQENSCSNYTSPQWLTNFCTNQATSPTNDGSCIYNLYNNYPIIGKTGSTSNPANASTAITQDVYYPYVIVPILGNVGNTTTTDNNSAGVADFINTSSGLYWAAIVQANVLYATPSQISNTVIQTAMNQGWIYAGGYFFYLIKQTGRQIANATPTFTFTGNNSTNLTYRSNYTAAGDLLTQVTSGTKSPTTKSGSTSLPGVFSPMASVMQGGADTILADFQNDLTNNVTVRGSMGAASGTLQGDINNSKGAFSSENQSNNNPLISIGTFGYQLMVIAETLFAVVFLIVYVLTAVEMINPIVLGNAISTLPPWGEALVAGLKLLTPFFIALITGIFSLGAVLGIYVPLIPFMIFTMGAIGWMLATIEAMVAAPIVALGILSPGGQSEILGRGEPALMLMLNLFLRPGLMIIGLMAGALVSIPVVKLVNTAFLATTSQMLAAPGIVEQVLFITIYCSFIITVISKCYSLIYVIPERVLTWIGGQAVQYGEGEALQTAKQGLEGGAAGLGHAGKEAGGTAVTSGHAMTASLKDHKATAAAESHRKMADKANAGDKKQP